MRKSKELPPPRIQGIWTTLIFFQVSWFFYVDRNKEQIEENISKISVRCDSFGAFLPHHRSRMNMVDFQFDSKVCNLKSAGDSLKEATIRFSWWTALKSHII